MVLVQKWPFFHTFFFRQYRPGKCLLRSSRTKKRLPRVSKQKVPKVEKLTFFQRVNPMALVQKWPIFRTFFFKQYRPGKFLLRSSRTKKRLCRLSKQEVQKVEKLTFLQRG